MIGDKNKEKLRIGILLDEDTIHAWQHKMLSDIENSTNSNIVLLIKNNRTKESNSKSHFVYNLYTRLDRKFFTVVRDAFEIKTLKSILNLDLVAIQDLNTIAGYNLDILIQLGTQPLEDKVLNIAKYGVWSFCFGDSKINRDIPHVFWQVIERKGEIGIGLQMELANESKMLTTSFSLTDNISVVRSENSYFWKAASILPRKIEALYRLGEFSFLDKVNRLNQGITLSPHKVKPPPSNGKTIKMLAKFKWKRIKNILRGPFYFNQWMLLFSFEESHLPSLNLRKLKKILPPKDRFWADPHVIKKNENYYIFIEELIFADNKGFISVIEMDNEGKYKNPVKILEKEYHLSYPFIIEDNGEMYMIPESKESNTIQLYKCVDFPFKWEFETVLMDKKAVDTTIKYKDGKYWMFTNMVDNDGASFDDELYLFSSDKLVSNEWHAHPENPIISDVKKARMAGRLFTVNGNLFRPAQNCSKHYGYGMQINQILEINSDNYKEEIVNFIYPDWDKEVVSTHSLSNAGDLTVIDAQINRKKLM